MDPVKVSDFDTAMMAKNEFDKILVQIQASHLNFQLRLSPFSASINLKKSFITDKSGCILLPKPANERRGQNSELVEKNEELKQKVVEMQGFDKSKSEVIQLLESKIANMEASAFKSFKDKSDEVSNLKIALKNSNREMTNLKDELRARNKLVKEKEKEAYKLDQKCENLEANLRRAKEEVNSIKSNYKKLQKKQKISDNKGSHHSDSKDIFSTSISQSVPTLAESRSTNSAVDSANNLVIETNLDYLQSVPGSVTSSTQASTASLKSSEDATQRTVPPPSSAAATAPAAWSSSPTSPPRLPPPTASTNSPYTPSRQPEMYEEKYEVEGDASKAVKDIKRKCMLSEEVLEVLKEEKLDFAKLVEAVKNDKMSYDLSEGETDDSYSNFDYEKYPDEYWDTDIHDVTEDDAEENKEPEICSN